MATVGCFSVVDPFVRRTCTCAVGLYDSDAAYVPDCDYVVHRFLYGVEVGLAINQ